MPKVKPEKIAGIVALSYLVLIPVGAAVILGRIRTIETDIDILWNGQPIEDGAMLPRPKRNLFQMLQGIRV